MAGSANNLSNIGPLRNMPLGRKIALAGAAALTIGAIWWLGRWASEPTFVSLFTELEFAQIAPMEEKLNKSGIRTKLGPSGSELLVPVADAARARVVLAKDGLVPQGRPGLELFDKPSWGMTDFTQRVTFQRAMEGELSRTIQEIRGVEKAQIHIVLPTPSPLRRLEKPASASVVLTVMPGVALPPETVRGITYIVSNSVEGLSAENVVVMDSQGKLLSMPTANGSGPGLASWQLDTQKAVEQAMVNKIEAMLATVLGPDKVQAQVSADVSFDQIDRTVETFDPDGQVLASEQRSETQAGGDGTANPAIVISNSYANSRATERSLSGAGKINQITAAVLVDEAALRSSLPNEDTAAATLRIEGMVRDAIGASVTRGDRVSVLAVPFGTAEPVPEGTQVKPGKQPLDLLMTAERVVKPIAGILAIVALLLLVLRLMRGMAPARMELSEAAALAGAGARPELPAGGTVAAALPAAAQAHEASAAGAGAKEPSGDPEAAAQVMRNWLTENS